MKSWFQLKTCACAITIAKKVWERELNYHMAACTHTHRGRVRERERVPSQSHDAFPCTTWRTRKKWESLSLKKAMFQTWVSYTAVPYDEQYIKIDKRKKNARAFCFS